MRATLALLCVLAGRARAQVDPSGTWRTLHTAHFRVHFRPAARAAAEREAREAERAYGLLSHELHPPRGIVDVVLGDDIDAANGFTTMFPTNRFTVFAAPPTTDPGLEHFDDWLRLVTTHDLTHVFHLDGAAVDHPPLWNQFDKRAALLVSLVIPNAPFQPTVV